MTLTGGLAIDTILSSAQGDTLSYDRADALDGGCNYDRIVPSAAGMSIDLTALPVGRMPDANYIRMSLVSNPLEPRGDSFRHKKPALLLLRAAQYIAPLIAVT